MTTFKARLTWLIPFAAMALFAAGCGTNEVTPNDTTDDVAVNDVAGDVAGDVVAPDVADIVSADIGNLPTTGYSAGMGVADVTGPDGMIMGGYGICINAPDACRYSEGAHDPLLSRAVAIRDNATGEFVIFITNDLVGVLRYDIDLIQEAAVERFYHEFGIKDFDTKRIIISATHTHHSTDTMGMWGPLDGSGRNEEYATMMRGKILDAAVDAYRDMKAVNIYWAGPASAPNYDDDKYADDMSMYTLRFEDKETSTTRFTMTRWSAHPTNYPQALNGFSAGHPGVFCKQMEGLTGAPAMYFSGVLGSVYPSSYEGCDMADVFPEGYQDPDLAISFVSDVTCIGTRVAEAAYAAIADEVLIPETGIKYRHHKLSFHPETTIPIMFDYTMFSFVQLGPLHFEVPPPDQINNPESTMDTQFMWVTIGDVDIVTMPGEGFPAFGKQIEAVMAPVASKIITMGLTGDWLGYILTEQQWIDDDGQTQYNKALSGGKYLPKRFLEDLQVMVDAEKPVD